MADNKTMTLDLDVDGKAKLSGGKVEMYKHDTLTISIGTGFPNAGKTDIVKAKFWNTDGHGNKGDKVKGVWHRDGDSTIPAGLSIDVVLSGVRFTDDDDGPDQDYYYNIVAEDGITGKKYHADPELVVHKSTKPPGQRAPQPRPPLGPDA